MLVVAILSCELTKCPPVSTPIRLTYLKVDSDNRLVADALEADWNGKLRDLDALQRDNEP
ncbi:hypothetical protein GCM10011494_19580 [Novosphingobium endophyticum]|uniref:Uncharacterized protein n=1 Tax=Novosphingobium endophyticum TaxID=1955250 RepID=A0A916TUU9_9SPHN|nr:hypothetical protein GCM10011494_19580 [Novosphingobium endophyticum]